MNAWLLLRRLRGPVFVIMAGITALLNQWGVRPGIMITSPRETFRLTPPSILPL